MIEPVVNALPFADLKMAWTVPALVAIVAGLVFDARRRMPRRV
ncbi:hypothetical protein [Trueperella pyogenes]|nr:hypothetical protein [Trueperella pyogenes]